MFVARTKRVAEDAKREDDDAAAPAAPVRRGHGRNPLRGVMGVPGLLNHIGRHVHDLSGLAAASSGLNRDVTAARAHAKAGLFRWVETFVLEFDRLHSELERWQGWPAADSKPPQPLKLPPLPSLETVILHLAELQRQPHGAFWGRLPMLDTARGVANPIAAGFNLCRRVPGGTHGLARLVLYERSMQPTHLTQAPIFLYVSALLTGAMFGGLHDGLLTASAALYRFLIVPDLLTPAERASLDFSGQELGLFYHRGSLVTEQLLTKEQEVSLDQHAVLLKPPHLRWDLVLQALSLPADEWALMHEKLQAASA